MNKYNIKVRFTFEGEVKITAPSKQIAREYVEKHFGMTIGNLHTSLNEDEIHDWEFPVHPEKKVLFMLLD